MRFARFRNVLIVSVLVLLSGYWLFADTARYYSRKSESQPLRISFRGSYLEYAMWSEMLDSFRKRYPDIPLQGEYVAGVSYEQKMQQLLVAGAAPDVMITDREPFPAMLQANYFEDLDPYLNTPGAELKLDAFWPDGVDCFRDSVGEEGRKPGLYGLACWGGCLLICYNRECFEAAGVKLGELPGPDALQPDGKGGWILDDSKWTNDDLIKLAHILTRDFDNDGRLDQFGMDAPGYFYWLPFLWAMGGDVLDDTRTHTTLYGPKAEKAFQLWQDLRFKYRICPGDGEMPMGSYVGLMSRRVAMMVSGPWAMPFLNDARVNYDFLHMPRAYSGGPRSTRVVWDGLLMYNQSKKKREAWLLMQHLVSPECQAILSKYQRSLPVRKDARQAFLDYNTNVRANILIDAIADYGRPGPLTKHWYTLERAMTESITQLIDPNPRTRLTPAQAFGCFLESEVVRRYLPPLDETEAQRYRDIYRDWRQAR